MLGRKTISGFAALAVGGVLVLGGCGGGSDSTNASDVTSGAAMKHQGDSMKQKNDHAMKDDNGAMHDEG